MTNLVRWLFSTYILRGALGLTAVFLGHSIGSEGIMITGKDLVLFGILIFGLIILFRFLCLRLNQKSSFLLVFLNIFIYFFISLFFFYFRIYFVSHFGLYLGDLFSSLFVFSVVSGGGHSLPLPAPSGASSSSSWTEDSFEMRVLEEPFPEATILHNTSLESSLRNRIVNLENEGSIFLLDKAKGAYWTEIKEALDQAPSQKEYQRLLEFESRDLQIRERKHSCYSVFLQVISQHPILAERACYNPKEAFLDFVDGNRDDLDTQGGSTEKKDILELEFLNRVSQDIRERGPYSIYIKKILGSND